ncbi:MAG TPA: hypothetical protein VJB59_01620 [Bdellovibrionota bacterium]|nr:hypothetical protein [Bdellovibrionota bacterium]
MQSAPLWRLPEELVFRHETPLFLWNLHPCNLVPAMAWVAAGSRTRKVLRRSILFPFLALKRAKLARLASVASERGGLVFMDDENLNATSQANGVNLSDGRFLPVPALDPVKTKTASSAEVLNLGWVGRLADFKAPILSYTIRKLADWARLTQKRVLFHLVGDGQFRTELERLEKEIRSPEFEIRFYGDLPVHDLEDILLKNIDLLFAMGTSALEGARLGIPVVLLDVSYAHVQEGYIFRMLGQSGQYCLGRMISSESYEPGNRSLDSILSKLNEDYDALSFKALAYFKANHSLSKVVEDFLNLVNKDQFTYGIAKRESLLRPDPITRFYYELRQKLGLGDYRIG